MEQKYPPTGIVRGSGPIRVLAFAPEVYVNYSGGDGTLYHRNPHTHTHTHSRILEGKWVVIKVGRLQIHTQGTYIGRTAYKNLTVVKVLCIILYTQPAEQFHLGNGLVDPRV